MTERDAGDDDGGETDEEQAGHLEPLGRGEAHPERHPGQVHQGQSGQHRQVRRKNLGHDLCADPQRRDAQRTDPALGPVFGDAGARSDGAPHGAVGGHRRHEVERVRDAVGHDMALLRCHHVEDDERQRQREEDGRRLRSVRRTS